MAYTGNSIKGRIDWCRWKQFQAPGQYEFEEWHAEEDGLRDALHNHDHSKLYQLGPETLFVRYSMGLQDGRILLLFGNVEPQIRTPREKH